MIHVTRPFAFNCAKERRFRAAKHHANNREEFDFEVVAKLAMTKLSVAAEPADWKENRITFAYTADTSTQPFTNNVQGWKEYGLTVNTEDASATWPDSAEYATGMNAIFT